MRAGIFAVALAMPVLAWSAATASGTASGPPELRAELGRYLFYDKRISVNGKYSCASCHRQELAFTDGRGRAIGATGELHPRSAMSLVNLASATVFTWADPTVHSLEQQALKPMFSTKPVEMGAREARLLELIRTERVYLQLFPKAFPGGAPYTTPNVAKALSAFERTIVSNESTYDRYRAGNSTAISEAAKRGEMLFFLDGPSCFRCHGGTGFAGRAHDEFHNNALYNLPGLTPFPPSDPGLYAFTKRAGDVGKFKAPTLRNIALTAPYMHDGSLPTLEAVLDHYAAGGRAHENPRKDHLMTGFDLTPRNRADLIAFLESLTDQSLIRNPALGDPW